VSATTDTQRGLWRVAGALAIAYVVIMLAGLSLQKVATVGASPSAYVTAYESGSLVKVMTGGCLTCASFLIFLLAATLLARLVRGQAEPSRWWASIAAASGAIYVAITLAVALPGVAAATYDGHHGAPLALVTALNDLHYFATFASMAVLGTFTLALAAASQASKALPRWIAYPGYAVGVLCLAAVPGAGTSLFDYATLVWFVWFVATGIAALRQARAGRVPQRAHSAAVS
jgi:hypothetical protein